MAARPRTRRLSHVRASPIRPARSAQPDRPARRNTGSRNERDPHLAPPPPVRISSAAADLDDVSAPCCPRRRPPSAMCRRCWTGQDGRGDGAKPGEGRTAFLWEILASVTAVDVAAGRVLEPHLDAVAILAQAGDEAARHGRDCPDPDGADFDGPGVCSPPRRPACGLKPGKPQTAGFCQGSKPWCSLAAQLDHAVLTAHLEAGGRAAFAVDLHANGAVGVVVVDLAGRAHLPNVGFLDELARLDLVTDTDGGDVDVRLDSGSQRDADQLRMRRHWVRTAGCRAERD